MLAKPVVLAFIAGIGLTAAAIGGFWLVAPGSPNEPAASEVLTVADGSLATVPTEAMARARAVDETETIVEDDDIVETSTVAAAPPPTPRPAPARSAPAPAPEPAPPIASVPPASPGSDADVAIEPALEPATEPAPEPAVEPAFEPADEQALEPEQDADREEGGDRDWDSDRPVSGTVLNDPERAERWEPQVPSFEELVISADSVISLQVDSSVSTETARIEDRVEARTIRDVQVGGDTAIPAGSLALASVTLVEPGGKVKERARLGIRFHTIVLTDGSEVPIQTETIYREGRSPSRSSSAKIGGAATAGAILGAIFGGKKGAVIGGAAGAAGGTAATMAGGRDPATLTAGTSVTIRLQEPATVTVER